MQTLIIISTVILCGLGAAILAAGVMAKNPDYDHTNPRDYMTPEEQEALETKERHQRELNGFTRTNDNKLGRKLFGHIKIKMQGRG